MKNRNAWTIALLALLAGGCNGGGDTSLTNDPAVPSAESAATGESEADVPKGETYFALFDTSEGDFIVAVHPGWAPLGAERFRELIETKYYDHCRFFRVLDGFMAQVGINGDPSVNAQWHDGVIPDDPVKVSNRRGRVTYAKSPQPNSRTTQVFFNFGDNGRLDPDGFAPFGEVVTGMDVLEKLYKDYGDSPPYGRGPNQEMIESRGNEYLQAEFPELDYIESARIFSTLEAAEAAMANDGAPGETPPAEAPATETPAAEAPATETPATESPAADSAAEPKSDP